MLVYQSGGYINSHAIRVAFVATNSITQGEQVSILWAALSKIGEFKITFAHRTFKWSNEAKGNAAVHCVIIGFAVQATEPFRLFEYDLPTSGPHARIVSTINPYLVEGPNIVVIKRGTPLLPVPPMRYGNKPTDGGHYILSFEERDRLLTAEPGAERWIRRYMGSEDFINGLTRYCLWLEGISPNELRQSPLIMKRVEAVRAFREASTAEPTRKCAQTPTRFFYVSQPSNPYIIVPEVSSEKRRYIPIGFMTPDVICSNTNYLIPDASLFVFGILTSAMHMAWTSVVCGRLKSDFRYSASIVYNTFPWPDQPTTAQREKIEAAAQAVLDARAQFPDATLADLYDPLTMPPVLVRAHQKLDAAVDKAYGKTGFKSDAERVAFLFERYQALTSLLPVVTSKRSRKKSTLT